MEVLEIETVEPRRICPVAAQLLGLVCLTGEEARRAQVENLTRRVKQHVPAVLPAT